MNFSAEYFAGSFQESESVIQAFESTQDGAMQNQLLRQAFSHIIEHKYSFFGVQEHLTHGLIRFMRSLDQIDGMSTGLR